MLWFCWPIWPYLFLAKFFTRHGLISNTLVSYNGHMILQFCSTCEVINFDLMLFCMFLFLLSLILDPLLCFQVLNRIGLDCPDIETLCIKDQALTTESLYLFCLWIVFLVIFYSNIYLWLRPFFHSFGTDVEKVVGWALCYHLMQCSDVSIKDAKLLISSERLLTLLSLFCNSF